MKKKLDITDNARLQCSVIATKQPCRTCIYFESLPTNPTPDGWCSYLGEDIKAWWTGCVRHSPADIEGERK